MAILRLGTRTQIDAVQSPCLVGIAGVGVSVCLDVGAKSKLTVVIIVNPLLGEELPGTEIGGDTSSGRKVLVAFHCHFFHKISDHYLGNGSVRQPGTATILPAPMIFPIQTAYTCV